MLDQVSTQAIINCIEWNREKLESLQSLKPSLFYNTRDISRDIARYTLNISRLETYLEQRL